ncbi:MAG: OST-HTH/LOTUS domain-containing protein, partial [Methylotenera sp.]|nr:OST-HTH/LOTUS domain-containing protein [Methylotenera sp.]
IVSSDSDFTRLAIRFRESGKLVYGFGEKKTPESLRAACTEFKYFEILSQEKISESTAPNLDTANTEKDKTKTGSGIKSPNVSVDETTLLSPVVKKTSQQLTMDAKLVSLIRSAIETISESTEDGFANLSEVKKHIVKNYSAFDSRNYGYAKFSDLINTIGLFELDAKKQRIKDKRKK